MNQISNTASNDEETKIAMQNTLELQRKAYIQEGEVSLETRINRIDRAIDILEKHGSKLCEAISSDFGQRPEQLSQMADIYGAISPLKYAKENLPNWMLAEDRKTAFPPDFDVKARVEYQPLGVIGCISPWNVPVQLTFGPLAGILAAGNRAMIKPSEYTPATSELMKTIIAENFNIEEIAIFTGGKEVGSAFSQLAFDHLLFTGAASVAKHVMRAAAENLVPVTLELGGKSPVIIGKEAPIASAAAKIMAGKTMNSGQICLAPDYVFVPAESQDEFINEAKLAVEKMYPTIKGNYDYTSIINQQNFERISNYIDDAQRKGAQVIQFNPANDNFSEQSDNLIPPTLIIDPTDSMLIMQEEVFGPVLSVKSYSDISETLKYINAHDRPLGLYYFGEDSEEQNLVLTHTTSGGVTINDVMMHAGQEDLPFGGVGASGMGVYHGLEGFRTFSHAKAIYVHSDKASQITNSMQPPYQKQ